MALKKRWKNHPAFPQPESDSTKLWRYMDFYKFESLLKNKRLVYPRADKLGESFEGTRPKGDIEWWNRKADNAKKNKDVLRHNSAWISDTAKFLKDKYFVSCWHMNEFENRFMWDSYTRSEKSIAIQTTYSVLSQCTHPSVPLGSVRYIDYSKERLPTMNMFEFIMHKEIYFKDESEVRSICFSLLHSDDWEKHFESNYFELENKPGFFCYAPEVDLLNLIKKVVFHPQMPDNQQIEIGKLCKENGIVQPEESRIGRGNAPTF